MTCQNSPKGVGRDRLQFTVNDERAFRTLKPSSERKKCFERTPSRPKFACKVADWFSGVSCNLGESSSVKTNQEIMIFMAKNKLHAFRSRSGIQLLDSGPGISEKTKETKVI